MYSCALYVFHYPLVIYVWDRGFSTAVLPDIIAPQLLGLLSYSTVAMGASWILALLSWRFLEVPFLSSRGACGTGPVRPGTRGSVRRPPSRPTGLTGRRRTGGEASVRESGPEREGVPNGDAVAVVVPAYQEAESIGNVAQALRARAYRVIVVDDGSTDATRDAALAAGAITLSHPINRGQGAAIQTGIDFAIRSGADYVVTFDADGQHDPDDVAQLLQALRDTGKDIALGSRFLGRAENITLARRLLLRAATLFTNLTTGVRLTDAHNGLRAMTAATAAQIEIRQDGMAHASEIIHQIRANGLEWVEVPVTVRYTEYSRAKGQSAFGSISVLYNLLTGRLR